MAKIKSTMKSIVYLMLLLFSYQHLMAQSEPYLGGIGRGDAQITQTNTLLGYGLPIELLNFEAILQNRAVDLNWQTASEHNNEFFTVERSADLFNFEPIAYIGGAGNSTELLSYTTQDLNPLDGVSYYRLKQTDLDGTFEYSDIRFVILGADNELLIFPNPSNTGLINFQNPAEIGELSIYSSEGKLVFKETVGNTLQVELNSGVYLARYEVAGFLKTKKIVITN